MEIIKVFLGMEIGRYDGYEFMPVLKTLPNGYKLCWLNHDEFHTDEDSTWDEIWIAKPDERFGWYGHDDLPIRTHVCDNWKFDHKYL